MEAAKVVVFGNGNEQYLKVKQPNGRPFWATVDQLLQKGIDPFDVFVIVGSRQIVEIWREAYLRLLLLPQEEPRKQKPTRRAPKPLKALPWRKPVRRQRR